MVVLAVNLRREGGYSPDGVPNPQDATQGGLEGGPHEGGDVEPGKVVGELHD